MKNHEKKMNMVAVILLLCVVAIFIIEYYNSNMLWIPVVVAAIAVGIVGVPLLNQVRKDMKNL